MEVMRGENRYPAWLYFFPMYVMLFGYAILGRTGYTLVADSFQPNNAFPLEEIILYYILMYVVYLPVIFLSQFIFYRVLSRRFDFYWKDIPRINKILFFLFNIIGVILLLWTERIFGVNAPYDTTWDFYIGDMYVWFGDFIFFIFAAPLFMSSFHEINYSICHQKQPPYQYQFYLVVVGTCLVGTVTQDWFWWISAPNPGWGPGVTIYFYFTDWLTIPFTNFYFPLIYFVIAIIALFILYLASVKIFRFKQYFMWSVIPYLVFVLIGNILFYAF